MPDITSNLVGHWRCQDNAASTAVVATVGAQGTLTNAGNTSASVTTGPTATLTSALLFDGTDDYINFGNVNNLAPNQAFTLAAWFKPSGTSPAAEQFLLSKQNTGGFGGWYFYRDGTAAGDPYKFGVFVSPQQVEISSPCTNTTAWRHVAIVNTGTGAASGFTIYEDAVALTRTVVADTWTNLDPTNAVNMQASGRNGANAVFPGAVADIRVYARALAQADISVLAGLSGFSQPLGRKSRRNLARRMWG